jgi:hypothetical protein
VAVTLGLAAVELLPVWSVLPWVQKSSHFEAGPNVPRNYQLNPINGFQLLAPGALGGPADYFGVDNYWELVLSMGLVPLVLLVVAVVALRRRANVQAWLALVVLSVWFAAGRQFGFFALCYWHLPGMSWFRVPARSLFLASLGAAMLAGYGLEGLQTRLADGNRWRRFARRAGAVVLVVVALLLVFNKLCVPVGSGSGTEVSLASESIDTPADAFEWPGTWALRPSKNVWRVGQATERILLDPVFWTTLGGLATIIGIGCLSRAGPYRRSLISLLVLVAIAELVWHGFELVRVTAVE